MRVRAVKVVLTIFPASIFRDVRTPHRLVVVQLWRSSKILLPVSIVAHAPIVYLRIIDWTERGFVAEKHEFFEAKLFFKLLQVL